MSRSTRRLAEARGAKSLRPLTSAENPMRASGARFPSTPEESAAFGVVEPLSILVRWSRLRFYERIADLSGVHLDRSTISILDVVGRMGPLRMSTVAELIGLDRSTVSRLVAARISDGYLQRTEDTSDARASIISLTEKGKTTRQKLTRAWQRIAIDLVADWSLEDQREAARLLRAISDKIRAGDGF